MKLIFRMFTISAVLSILTWYALNLAYPTLPLNASEVAAVATTWCVSVLASYLIYRAIKATRKVVQFLTSSDAQVIDKQGGKNQ